jgi:anti-sigma28 factor (negative regulator of flagellin synthesis)
MVDSISNKPVDNSLLSLISTDKTDAAQAAGDVSTSQKTQAAPANADSTDAATVTISAQARQAAEAEKSVLKFSRLAQRDQSPFDTDKVATFKAMLDNGKINDYLRGLNTDSLAASLLKGNQSFLVSK